MAGPFVYLGDGGGDQAQGGNTGAGAGADGQVAGHGEGFRRQGTQVHVAAPAFKEPPLGAVDAPGVVGEGGLQGVGHAPVGGAQLREGRGRAGDDLGVRNDGHGQVSGGGITGRFEQIKAAR